MLDGLQVSAGYAMVVSPLQWVALALIVVTVFAPRLLPPLGRLAGRSLGEWIRTTLGLPASRVSRPPRVRPSEEPEVQVLRSPRREHTLRAGSRVSLAETARTNRPVPVWPVVAVVSLAVAVLLWVVLHPR